MTQTKKASWYWSEREEMGSENLGELSVIGLSILVNYNCRLHCVEETNTGDEKQV